MKLGVVIMKAIGIAAAVVLLVSLVSFELFAQVETEIAMFVLVCGLFTASLPPTRRLVLYINLSVVTLEGEQNTNKSVNWRTCREHSWFRSAECLSKPRFSVDPFPIAAPPGLLRRSGRAQPFFAPLCPSST